jgi:hypothetical protein
MYGKAYQRMYQGSMVGAGSHVFAVWGYCIANADSEAHTVDLNPKLLSTVIGDTEERIEEAIRFLTSPDPHSHCEDHEGRRLLPTGGMEYFLVTHEQYRDMKNKEELRAYMRDAKRKQRAKDMTSNDVKDKSKTSVSVSVSVFDTFWKVYPKKVGKRDALRAWQRAKDKPPIEAIVQKIEECKRSEQWRKDNGQFIPNPATWLNQGRWEDEIQSPDYQRRGIAQ